MNENEKRKHEMNEKRTQSALRYKQIHSLADEMNESE